MIGTIRRHQKWLWIAIITVTVASFVIFGPTNARMGSIFGNHSSFGAINGSPITSEERANAAREVMLDNFFKTQQMVDLNSPEANREVYYRIFLIRKQKEFGIEASPKAVADEAKRVMGQAAFDLDGFTEKYLKPAGLSELDLDRFFRHEVGLHQMLFSVGVNGKLTTPQEIESMYKLDHQEIETYLADFSASNYLSQVTVTPALINEFYTNEIDHYRVPDLVQVDYVKFNVTNYFKATMAALTNIDDIVEQNVQRLGTNLFRNTKTPADSKAAIRSEIIRQHAILDARHAADDFALALDQITPRTNSNLALLAKSNNFAVVTSRPFDRDNGPEYMGVTPDFAKKAFGLSFDDPFVGDIVAEDGVYVIALKSQIPAETPPLSRIEDKVTADFRYASGVQLAQQAAIKFHSVLTNDLAHGKSFEASCAQNGVKLVSVPPFSLDTRSMPTEIEEKVNFTYLRQAAFSTPPGHASPVAQARDGAFILYVARQLPIDQAKMKADLPVYTAYIRTVRQNDAFNEWFNLQARQDPGFLEILQQLNSQSSGKSSGAQRPSS